MDFFENVVLIEHIMHRYSVVNPAVVIEHYTTDEYPVKYVCTTSIPNLSTDGDLLVDVYYQPNRPDYPNNYFGIFKLDDTVRICGADDVETLSFALIDDDITGLKIYSRGQHDFAQTSDQVFFVDGGRDYTRTNTISTKYVVRDGAMIPVTWTEER